MSKWIVHKFGGTSVADADRYRAAAAIVLRHAPDERVAVVVSAMSGVTNGLIQSVELAAGRNDSYVAKLQELQTRHLETIEKLSLTTPQTAALRETVAYCFCNSSTSNFLFVGNFCLSLIAFRMPSSVGGC